MSPEDWHNGMHNEASSVNDEAWAAETRQAAGTAKWQRSMYDVVPLGLLTVLASSVTCLLSVQNGIFNNAQRNQLSIGEYFWQMQVHTRPISMTWSSTNVQLTITIALLAVALVAGLASGWQRKSLWVPFALSLAVPLGVSIAQSLAGYPFDSVFNDFFLHSPVWPTVVAGFTLTGWHLGQRLFTTRHRLA